MKKIYLILLLLVYGNSNAQFNPNAPWLNQNNDSKQVQKTFSQIVDDFNQYWKDKDKNKKGSGYKPFKRWENFWKDHLDQNGFVMTPEAFKEAINQKNVYKKNKGNSSKALPVSNWSPIGPIANSSTNPAFKTRARGRVNIITADPNNPNTLYFGTPAGGLWKSTNAGVSWSSLTDELPQIGVSGIAIDHTNSNTIYISTGDKDAGDTDFAGVYKSTDGGITWNNTGTLSGVVLAGDILMHPTNNQVLLCATSAGIFRTSNGGTTWTNVQAGTFHQGSIRFKPNAPDTVYSVSKNAFYKSTNAGASFANVAITGTSTSNRMLLDVTPANPDYVYVLSAKGDNTFNAIHRSVDGGATFSKRSAIKPTDIFESNQAWYDLALAASSTNAEEIYVGCLNIWKSTDGGAANANWSKLNNWSTYNQAFTHADIHHLQYFNGKLYCGSDGGIYTSTDSGINFTDITGQAQISQFYKIAVSKQTADNMSGGTQDNGGYALSNNTWKGYHGGDGMDSAVNPLNKNVYYGFMQYGATLFTTNDGGVTSSAITAAPTAETNSTTGDDGGNWVTPMAINSQSELFAGYSRLYRLSNGAWIQQSASTIGTGDIENIEIDPRNDNNMFVSNGSGLYKSTDKGVNFTNVYTATSSITSINVDANNSNTIYITTSGTGGGVFKSTNGGASFTAIGNGIPSVAKLVVKHQARNTQNPIYVGTSIGVYYRDDSMTQFEPFDTNLPNTPISDLEVNTEDALLIAGTYGRGAWKTTIPVDPYPNDVKLLTVNANTTNILCNNVVTPTVTVKNSGTSTINSVDVVYNYNGSNLNYTWTGAINPSANQLITLPQITLTNVGAFKLNVTTTIINDGNSENNTGFTNFFINNSESFGVTNTFNTVSDELLAHDDGEVTSIWTRGINTNGALATPGNNVYSVGQTALYPVKKKSFLYSKCYNFTNAVNPVIRFKMGFALEQNWDVLYVEYSTNMGQTWSVLGTQGTNWYNSNRTPATSGTDCFNCPGAQWTGGSGLPDTGTGAVPALTNYFYALNSLIGNSNVIFRFVFDSDDAVVDLGVTIDDFVIDGTLSNEEFELKNVAIFPNPSKDIFTISLGDQPIDKLQVYDVSGKIIFETVKSVQNQYNLDLSSASSGIYFIKIFSNNQNTVKRIIKN